VLLVTPAPVAAPGAPVNVGAAQITCEGGTSPDVEHPGRLPAYSCEWGGEMLCTALNGCMIYTWDAIPRLAGWAHIDRARALRLRDRVRYNVVEARRAVASVEVVP
jgi:hypothetical protein